MALPLRNLALSAFLIAVPAGGFALAETYLGPTTHQSSVASTPLGDLSAYKDIVADTQRIASSGDITAAERRITDLETLWDNQATALRQVDQSAWTAVDGAADDAFAALRAKNPDPAAVDATLATLQSTLEAPAPLAATGPVQYVTGIAVTDESGRALPCEDLVGQLRNATAGVTPTAKVAELQSKALERCNADDDARADAFAAQALSQIKG